MKTLLLKNSLIPVIFLLLASPAPTVPQDSWEERQPSAINSSAYPGQVEPHSNSGGRRMVRIDDHTIVICPHGTGERTYRSVDDGKTWLEIDRSGAPSGSLISGPDKMVFHFYRSGDNIYMVRFRFDEIPPPPVSIYFDDNLSEGGHGVYNMLTATVSGDGTIYVITHWDNQNSDGGDSIYLIRSVDGGDTWTPAGAAAVIHEGSGDHSWGYAHFDVTADNKLIGVYSEYGSKSIQYAESADKGATWSIQQVAKGSSSGVMYNPAVLPVGIDKRYVFAQSSITSRRGLVFKDSINAGQSWSEWKSIDNTSVSL